MNKKVKWRNEATRLKQVQEATDRGLVLLNKVDGHYNNYRLSCGHEQIASVSQVRSDFFSCKTCGAGRQKRDQSQEATERGLLLLSKVDAHYNKYLLGCGHEQLITAGNVRKGGFSCKTCGTGLQKRDQVQEAITEGILLLDKIDSNRNNYLLRCGHTQEIRANNVRISNYTCRTCYPFKDLDQEAVEQGIKRITKGKNKDYSRYKLRCGHEREIQHTNVRYGNFRCNQCGDEYFYTKPSNLYLVLFSNDDTSFLKLGYAKNVSSRIKQYGALNINHEVLFSVPISTGKLARELEEQLHKKYTSYNLPATQISRWLTESGATECYPTSIRDLLLKELLEMQNAKLTDTNKA